MVILMVLEENCIARVVIHNTSCIHTHSKGIYYCFYQHQKIKVNHRSGLQKLRMPTVFHVVTAGYWDKFSTSNNHASVERHRLWYCHCAKLTPSCALASYIHHIQLKVSLGLHRYVPAAHKHASSRYEYHY